MQTDRLRRATSGRVVGTFLAARLRYPGQRNGEKEPRTVAFRTLKTSRPSVQFREMLDDRQSQAQAAFAKLLTAGGMVQHVERREVHLENVGLVRLGDAHSPVNDLKAHVSRVRLTNVHADGLAVGGELDGVHQEV